jgi:hypothetical protein
MSDKKPYTDTIFLIAADHKASNMTPVAKWAYIYVHSTAIYSEFYAYVW